MSRQDFNGCEHPDASTMDANGALDDPGSGRRDLAEGVDMRHDIVPPFLLLCGRNLKLLLVQVLPILAIMSRSTRSRVRETHKVSLHLLDGLICDRQTELLLRDGKVQPQFPPCVEAILRDANQKRWVRTAEEICTADEKR